MIQPGLDSVCLAVAESTLSSIALTSSHFPSKGLIFASNESIVYLEISSSSFGS